MCVSPLREQTRGFKDIEARYLKYWEIGIRVMLRNAGIKEAAGFLIQEVCYLIMLEEEMLE